MVASITEETASNNDEEIATVDGDEPEDMELRDADGNWQRFDCSFAVLMFSGSFVRMLYIYLLFKWCSFP